MVLEEAEVVIVWGSLNESGWNKDFNTSDGWLVHEMNGIYHWKKYLNQKSE